MMTAVRFAAGMSIRACRETVAACRPALAAALPAALTLAMVIGITACDPHHGQNPVQAAYARPGPYATTTGTVKDPTGKAVYDLFYPRHYAALGFSSPIVTWGNGTTGRPAMVSTLLGHLASYGFTVIASTSGWTGSGTQIDAAAHYLAAQDTTAGSVFYHKLDVHKVAAVGHSQGAGGAVRAATHDPALITTVLTFSLPNTFWARPNPGCPTRPDCLPDPARLLHLHRRALRLIHREPGHRKSLLPQHHRPRRAGHHPRLRRRDRRPQLDREHRLRRKPRRRTGLRHRMARIPVARQHRRRRRLHRRTPRTSVEHQLARQRHQIRPSRRVRSGTWHGAGDQAGGVVVVAGGLRATPQNSSTSAGGPSCGLGSGRQREHDTTPGASRSRPSKKRAICCGLRSVIDGVPTLFQCATASSMAAPWTALVEWLMTTKLPGASAATSRLTIEYASSVPGM